MHFSVGAMWSVCTNKIFTFASYMLHSLCILRRMRYIKSCPVRLGKEPFRILKPANRGYELVYFMTLHVGKQN